MTAHLIRGLLLAAGVAFAVVISGCDDDDAGGEGPGNGDTTPVASRPTLEAGFIEGNTFTSVSKGYRVVFPEGWNPDENFIDTPPFAMDAFINPETEGGVQPNVTVRCDYAESEGTLAEFVDVRRRVIQGFALGDMNETEITLDGAPAVRIDYEQRSGETDLAKTDIFAVQGPCAWTITFTQAADGDNADLFEQMLGTFEFTTSSGT